MTYDPIIAAQKAENLGIPANTSQMVESRTTVNGMRGIKLLASMAILSLAACTSTGQRSESSNLAQSVSPPVAPQASVSASAVPAEFEVYAKLGLTGANAIVRDDTCLPYGDYVSFDDDGLQGVVKDASGTTVGIGEFGAVEVFEGGCMRTFTVSVPAGGGFYTLEAGDWTSKTYSESDAEVNGLTLIADAP